MSELPASPVSPASASPAPTPPPARITAVDILRGCTLFGVLAANMAVFSLPGTVTSQGPNYWTDPVDKAAQLLLMLSAVGEFYVPFSFLFGWGLAVQMARAEAWNARVAPLTLRRLLVLLLIGLIHAVLIWNGDVLVIYAVLGLPLILLRKLSNRVILALAVVCLLAALIPAPTFIPDYNQAVAGLRHDAAAGQRLYLTGDYLAMVGQRIAEVKSYYTGAIYWGPYIFGMFLLGLYAARRGFLQNIPAHSPLFRRWLWLGLLMGLPLTAFYVLTTLSPDVLPADLLPLVRRAARILGGLGLCCFYLSAIVLLVQQEKWRDRLAFLAPVGRMTLTNYLMQSIVCTLIFYGYGLGLYGRLGPALGLLLAAVIFCGQVKLSAWWLDRCRFGPMEWLWRSLTYLKLLPLRLESDGGPGLNRRTALILAGVVALVMTGVGGWWWLNRQDGPAPAAIVLPLPQPLPPASPTATPRFTQTPRPTPIGTPAISPVARTPGPAAARGDIARLGRAFDEEQAFAEIETLTDPAYAGRQAGSLGGQAAGDYIARRFAEYGLQPAGLDGSYFQPFPVLYTTLAETPQLVVTGPGDVIPHAYRFRVDYSTSVGRYAGAGTVEGPVIWANDGAHDDYTGVDATGKIVLCRETGGSRDDKTRNALEHGAAGLLLLADPQTRPLDFIGPNREVWVPAPIPVFRVTPAVAQDLLAGTGLTLDDLTVRFASFPLSTTARLAVALRTDTTAPGRNVLGVLPGRDPGHAGQVVVLGAHYDHMGQDPGGTFWPGANDDASGVAVLLEIARSWQEQGYTPRRTVVFAAWDAEEIGLVGSAYYVAHPVYPLTATVAMLQLDMVGAGGDLLDIEGTATLNARLAAIAPTLGITVATSTTASGSDHVPFIQAGVPASLLIWSMDAGATPDYHRPSDMPAVIQPDRLAGAGRLTNLALLALVEGEPAINDVLTTRAAALRRGDAVAYLSTSTAARQAADRAQFDALRAVDPIRLDFTASDWLIAGNIATVTVQMSVQYIATDTAQPVTVTQSARALVRFLHGADGWQWDGPALTWTPAVGRGFAVAHPPDRQRDPGLGALTAARYVTITAQLGLPPTIDAALLLYPSEPALWADTTFPQPLNDPVWIGADGEHYRVKQVAGRPVLTSTLVQLALARAGVTEAAAPWLWRGLPRVWAAAEDPVAAQTSYLPQLEAGLRSVTATLPADVTAWAATDYLHRRVGWAGIGRLATTLGRGASLDEALTQVVGADAAGFAAAWRADWTRRLDRARAGLTALLQARQAAVRSGDEAAFLRTVPANDPLLLAEERAWFADLQAHPVEDFTLTGQPIALLDDSRLLASVTLRYRRAGRETTLPLAVLLTPDGSSYCWAGPPWETLAGAHVVIHYPAGQNQLARDLRPTVEAAYAQTTADLLGYTPATPLVLKLYAEARDFRAAVALSLPDGTMSGTGPGQALRLLARSAAPDRRALAREAARYLLAQDGDLPEWLREGIAQVESGALSRADAEQLASVYGPKVLRAAQSKRLFPLAAMPPFSSLSDDDRSLALAQSWDAVRYLADAYGWKRLRTLSRNLAVGQSLDDAFRNATGLSLADFEARWQESAARGHAQPAWIAAAHQFDPEAALRTVTVLAGPSYAGRQAGSPGAQAAARYIAGMFAATGLTGAGDGGAYFQQVPISYTVMTGNPSLTLQDPRGQWLSSLAYRRDFTAVTRDGAGGGRAEGDLVWVRGDYAGLRLAGKIVLRQPPRNSPLADEIRRAVAHGAGGLILVQNRTEQQLQAKVPLPVNPPLSPPIGGVGGGIPVLEITEDGLERLLAAGGHTRAEVGNSPPAMPLRLRARLEVPLSAPVAATTVNVLGLLPGADPARRAEVVIVSAHYDHVGDDPDGTRYPGANDDAAGVGVLLEIARTWQKTGYQPARSVLFAAWGAQETGEVGSGFYVAHPAFPLTRTVAVLHLDAVGGGRGFRLQSQGDLQREAWPLFALEAAADLVDGRLAWGKPLGQSDQQPFQRAGVPAVLLTWTDANEENLPAALADEVQPYRLGVTGRTVSLALMMLAQ